MAAAPPAVPAENEEVKIPLPPGCTDLTSILLFGTEIGVSDIHLSVGEPPMFRLHGSVVPTNLAPMNAETLHHMLYDLLQDDQRKRLERDKELDFALQFGEYCRFRVNCFYTIKGEGAVFRVIPTRIRSLEELGMPPVLKRLCERRRGIILVTGPTGSGKSTTLAAMIDHINATRDEHMITIEDPVEFVHTNKRCIINQRELGSSTQSFAAALRSALREDPDIILVGELRDLETISLALTAAETGHLVFGTLHTQSAMKTCDRVIDVFPPEQQQLVRLMFAESFQAIVCQQLVPKASGDGRVCAMEIMVGTAASRSLIREGKTHQLQTIIQTSQKVGMQTLDQHLKYLLEKRVITEEDALAKANNPGYIAEGGEEKLDQIAARPRGKKAFVLPKMPEHSAVAGGPSRPPQPPPPGGAITAGPPVPPPVPQSGAGAPPPPLPAAQPGVAPRPQGWPTTPQGVPVAAPSGPAPAWPTVAPPPLQPPPVQPPPPAPEPALAAPPPPVPAAAPPAPKPPAPPMWPQKPPAGPPGAAPGVPQPPAGPGWPTKKP